MKRFLILVFLLPLFSGCAQKFSCGQFPKSGCQPVSSVYERTNGGLNDYRNTLFNDKTKSSKQSQEIVISKSNRALDYVQVGDPILTKPMIIRVLIAPWEDKDKDLYAGGFMFLKLRDSEWVMKN